MRRKYWPHESPLGKRMRLRVEIPAGAVMLMRGRVDHDRLVSGVVGRFHRLEIRLPRLVRDLRALLRGDLQLARNTIFGAVKLGALWLIAGPE